MPDEQTANGAVQAGTERVEPVAEPKPTVAEGGEQAETPAKPEPIDLSQIEEFRRYDANRQRKEAELERRVREAEAKAAAVEQLARKERSLSTTRSRLLGEGLDEKSVREVTADQEIEVQQLRAYKTMRDLLDEYGFTSDQLEKDEWGNGPEELRQNLTRKKAKLELEKARAEIEEAKKEAERLKTEAQKLAKEAELGERRATGADRLAGGEPMPRPADQEALWSEYQKAVNKALTGLHKVQIRQQFRDRGLSI